MNADLLFVVSKLSDSELLEETKRLSLCEFDITARLVAHLAEVESRGLHLGQGCQSMYTYCVEILHLSKHEAHLRIEVARACRKYPAVLDFLSRGEVNLTNVSLLIPVLTPENHVELLEAAKHKTKSAVEDIVKEMRAECDRKGARANAAGQNDLFQGSESGAETASDGDNHDTETPITAGSSSAGNSFAGNSPGSRRCRFEFMATLETRDKLRRLQDLLSYEIPSADPAMILDRALTHLLREVERKKLAMTDRPRAGRAKKRGTRTIPAAVRRAVWARDGGQCAFVGENGHRCTERRRLQWHHLDPHGDGGEATVSNIELRFPGHNRYEADLYYGPWRADPVRDPGFLESFEGATNFSTTGHVNMDRAS